VKTHSDTHDHPTIYGLVAEFDQPEPLMEAARRAREQGYRHLDAFTPFPVDGLPEALGLRPSRLPLLVLLAAVAGGAGAYFLQWYTTVIEYPLDIGGRPLHSWPAFIPVTFELAILSGAVAAVVGMLFANRLPMPYHPLFNVPGFDRVSRDRFFLCIESSDPAFDMAGTRQFLEGLKPRAVREVPR